MWAACGFPLDLPILEGVSLQPRGYVLSSPLSFYDDRTLEALYFRRHAGGDLSAVFESRRLWHIRLGGLASGAGRSANREPAYLIQPGSRALDSTRTRISTSWTAVYFPRGRQYAPFGANLVDRTNPFGVADADS